MGTEGDRKRNRARRIKEKEQKRIKKKWDIPLIWIIIAILVPWLIYKQYRAEQKNLSLYKTGVETTAFIYDTCPRKGIYTKLYEFYVNDRRYTGSTLKGKLGYTTPIVYLPADPNINENVDDLNSSFAVMFYKWFNKEHDSD